MFVIALIAEGLTIINQCGMQNYTRPFPEGMIWETDRVDPTATSKRKRKEFGEII